MNAIRQYQADKRAARLKVRLAEARDLIEQAEQLVRISEHVTFENALALLERLRNEEAVNDGVKQQCAEAIAPVEE